MKVLLSIMPKFVEKIISGKKKFEYRRRIFKKESIESVVVYASSPWKQVIGEFTIIKDELNNLWTETKEFSGISEDLLGNYFRSAKVGYAIEINKLILYKTRKDLMKHYGIISPPQSFLYIK